MKTLLRITACALALAGTAWAADPSPAPLLAGRGRGNAQGPPPVHLPENMVVAIRGVMNGVPLEWICTTASQSMIADSVIGEVEINGVKQPMVSHFQAQIKPDGDNYRVNFSLSLRQPLGQPTADGKTGATTVTVAFANVGLQLQEILMKPGQPVVLVDSPSWKITATVSKAETP